MTQQSLSQLLEVLKKQGLVDLTLPHLEQSRQLLIRYEFDANLPAIARLSVLKYQHPGMSDDELIKAHIDLQEERATSQPGYGGQIAKTTRDDIWDSLQQSGIIEQIAQDLRFTLADAIMQEMVNPLDDERQNIRQKALLKTTRNFNLLSRKQDAAIDVDYRESDDDLNAIIGQALTFSSRPDPLRLPGAGDTFRSNAGSLPASADSAGANAANGANGAKKLQLHATNGTGKA